MYTPYVFNRFGQLAEMPDELAAKSKLLISVPDWENGGITTEEVKLFGQNPGADSTHPLFAAFKAKRNALWKLAQEPAGTIPAEPEAQPETQPEASKEE